MTPEHILHSHIQEEEEGVTQFQINHQTKPLIPRQYQTITSLLSGWRALFFELKIIGQDPQRYGGAGYGNLSARLPPMSSPRGERSFLITGTQTGAQRRLGLDEYSVVTKYRTQTNQVTSFGPSYPSSESMTHGALYDLNIRVRYVFHVHAPLIWRSAGLLKLPTTSSRVGYGTPEMADAVQRLYQQGRFELGELLVMGGHQDGVISCGYTLEEAGAGIINAWVKARQLMIDEQDSL